MFHCTCHCSNLEILNSENYLNNSMNQRNSEQMHMLQSIQAKLFQLKKKKKIRIMHYGLYLDMLTNHLCGLVSHQQLQAIYFKLLLL